MGALNGKMHAHTQMPYLNTFRLLSYIKKAVRHILYLHFMCLFFQFGNIREKVQFSMCYRATHGEIVLKWQFRATGGSPASMISSFLVFFSICSFS